MKTDLSRLFRCSQAVLYQGNLFGNKIKDLNVMQILSIYTILTMKDSATFFVICLDFSSFSSSIIHIVWLLTMSEYRSEQVLISNCQYVVKTSVNDMGKSVCNEIYNNFHISTIRPPPCIFGYSAFNFLLIMRSNMSFDYNLFHTFDETLFLMFILQLYLCLVFVIQTDD